MSSPTMRRRTSHCVALAALVSATCAAQAPPSTYVGVTAGLGSDSSTSALPQTLSITGIGLDGLGIGDAMAVARFGSLGVAADATAAPAEAFPTVSASAEASFSDNLFIAGPASTPVSITFSLELFGSCFASAGDVFGHADAGCVATGSLSGPPALSIGVTDSRLAGSVTIDWIAGNVLPIAADLRAGGFAWNGSFDASFGDTLHVYAYSTTPGASITSESGHDYSPSAVAAVPEPASAMLLSTGLIGVAWARRRARASAAKASAPTRRT